MKVYSDAEHVNVGSGEDIAIYELAKMVAEVVGFTGEIVRERLQARRKRPGSS